MKKLTTILPAITAAYAKAIDKRSDKLARLIARSFDEVLKVSLVPIDEEMVQVLAVCALFAEAERGIAADPALRERVRAVHDFVCPNCQPAKAKKKAPKRKLARVIALRPVKS